MAMYKVMIAMAALFLVGCGGAGRTQQPQQAQRAGGARTMPQWDSSTVQTVKGTVDATRQGGQVEMIVVMLKGDTGESHVVMLAPKQVLDPALASLATATPIEVTGSKVKGPQRDLILASKVKVGGKEYAVRNDQGQLLDKDGQPVKSLR
jgi:hypothetical protein